MGDYKLKKQCSYILAAISEEIEVVTGASWQIIALPVFYTDLIIVSAS